MTQRNVLRDLLIIALALLAGMLVSSRPASVAAQAPRLVKLSEREYVDANKIDYVLFPVYVSPPPGCLDCQTRWGATMVVNGVRLDYLPEAEPRLKEWVSGR